METSIAHSLKKLLSNYSLKNKQKINLHEYIKLAVE